jgi:dihydrofolate reductase
MKNFQKKKNISIIVAVAENNAIGYKNQLLYHLPDDLKRFKKITSGHPVVMGRNTFLSLPKGALPNRTNIVISDIPGEEFPGCSMADSIEDALAQTDDTEEAFIIGGGMIYRQFLPHASKLYITKIHHTFEADTFFPEISQEEWTEVSKETNPASSANPFEFSYIIYERK